MPNLLDILLASRSSAPQQSELNYAQFGPPVNQPFRYGPQGPGAKHPGQEGYIPELHYDNMLHGRPNALNSAFGPNPPSDKMQYFDLMGPMMLQQTPGAASPESVPYADLLSQQMLMNPDGSRRSGRYTDAPQASPFGPGGPVAPPLITQAEVDRAQQPAQAAPAWTPQWNAEQVQSPSAPATSPPSLPEGTWSRTFTSPAGVRRFDMTADNKYVGTGSDINGLPAVIDFGQPQYNQQLADAARQRAMLDPQTLGRLELQRLENQGRLDVVGAQDRASVRDKGNDAAVLAAAQATANISDPVEKIRMMNKLVQLYKVENAMGNTELSGAGITGSRKTAGVVDPNAAKSITDDIASKYNSNAALHKERIASILMPKADKDGVIKPLQYTPEMASSLAEIMQSATTPQEQEQIANEVIRLAPDKNLLGDAMVRSAAGHASMLGLPGVGPGAMWGADLPGMISGKDIDTPFDLGSDLGFFGSLARTGSGLAGKPEVFYNMATLPGGRKVRIESGDYYGGRAKAVADQTDLQAAKLKRAAIRKYLEALMNKGYYGKAD